MNLDLGSQVMFSLSAMLIVFSVLLCVKFIIELMGFVFKQKEKPQVVESVEKYVDETAIEEDDVDDCEVIAAIMAALSATLDVPTNKLMIRSIKRLDRSSNWRN